MGWRKPRTSPVGAPPDLAELMDEALAQYADIQRDQRLKELDEAQAPYDADGEFRFTPEATLFRNRHHRAGEPGRLMTAWRFRMFATGRVRVFWESGFPAKPSQYVWPVEDAELVSSFDLVEPLDGRSSE